MAHKFVKPHPDLVREGRVALWDQHDPLNPVHADIDERWNTHGGAFIAGNPDKPDATYKVADTQEVRDAIRLGRLVEVSEKDAVDANATVPPPAPLVLDDRQFLGQQQADQQSQIDSLKAEIEGLKALLAQSSEAEVPSGRGKK